MSSQQDLTAQRAPLTAYIVRWQSPTEGQQMFAVGHLALGYILGKATSKSLNVDLNIPLALAASIIPDIDLLIPGLEHRGPTHSLILIFLIFLPAFALYRARATPYFVAGISHSIIGDIITSGGCTGEGVQLLWPLTSYSYRTGVKIASVTNIFAEWTLFLAFMTIMFKTKDIRPLFQHHRSNLLLSIPVFTVLLPTMLSFPLPVPPELIIPHLTYLTIFALSILIDLRSILRRPLAQSSRGLR